MTTDIRLTQTVSPSEEIGQRPPKLNNEAINTLSTQGWVLLSNVAAVERQIAEILAPLGPVMPQYGQLPFWRVEARDIGKGTSLGDQELRLHTELAEFETPPRYVALFAEKPAEYGGALRLFDTRKFIAALTPEELKPLLSINMTVRAEDQIAKRYGDYSYTGPILSVTPHGLRLRFDQYYIDDNGSKEIREFRDRLVEYAEEWIVEIKQPKASLLIWDNHYVVHGRSSFTSSKRRIWRCCIR